MSDCTHDLAERETACADGMCPICTAAENERLRAEVAAIPDDEMRKMWVPLSEHQNVVDERDRLLRENKKMKSAILDKMVSDSEAARLYDAALDEED